MLKIPCTAMVKPTIVYDYGKDQKEKKPDKEAKWNLIGDIKFVYTPQRKEKLRYYTLIDEQIKKDEPTIATYETVINKLVKRYGIGVEAQCLQSARISNPYADDATHNSRLESFKQQISALRSSKPGGTLVFLILQSRHIPAYSAFKDATDRGRGMHSICLT